MRSLRVLCLGLALVALAGLPAAAAESMGPAESAEARAALADDARTLCTALAGWSATSLEGPFDRMRERVALYADWVFGWRSSLMTTFELGRIAVDEAGRNARDPVAIPDAIEARYSALIRDRFMDLVVQPARWPEGQEAPGRRLMSWLVDLDRRLAEERADRLRLRRGPRSGQTPEAGGAADDGFVDGARPLLPQTDDWALVVAPPLQDLPADQVRLVMVRSLRPLGSRAAGIAVRMTVFEAVAGATVFQSPEVSWLAGMVAASGAAIGMTALVDGTANWVHAWVGRDALIADLQAVLDEAEQAAADAVYAHVVAHLADLDPPLSCPAERQATAARVDAVVGAFVSLTEAVSPAPDRPSP